jgi:hypothetical protein
MRGRHPKPEHLRQRRNKVSTRATLPSEAAMAGRTVPKLPKRRAGMGSWHPRVLAWWASVWHSPMAAEYLAADRQRLELVAELHQQFWNAVEDSEPVTKLAAEIRQQEVLFGLTPMDRRRLQWEVDKGEEAAKRTEERRKPAPQPDPAKDPRDVLKAVS